MVLEPVKRLKIFTQNSSFIKFGQKDVKKGLKDRMSFRRSPSVWIILCKIEQFDLNTQIRYIENREGKTQFISCKIDRTILN